MSPLLSSSSIKNNSKTLGIIVDNISAEIIGILKDLILLSAGPTSVTYEIIYPKPLESSIARNAGWRLRNQSTAISSWRASYSVNCLFSSFFSNFSIFYFLSSFSIQNSTAWILINDNIMKSPFKFEYNIRKVGYWSRVE